MTNSIYFYNIPIKQQYQCTQHYYLTLFSYFKVLSVINGKRKVINKHFMKRIISSIPLKLVSLFLVFFPFLNFRCRTFLNLKTDLHLIAYFLWISKHCITVQNLLFYAFCDIFMVQIWIFAIFNQHFYTKYVLL